MKEIIGQLNDEISNLRNLIYLLDHELFKKLYNDCSDDLRDEVNNYIYLRDRRGVKRWIDAQRSLNLDTMSLGELRNTAKHLGVTYWHRLSKPQLIARIVNKRKEAKDVSNRRPTDSESKTRENEGRNPQTPTGGESQSGLSPL